MPLSEITLRVAFAQKLRFLKKQRYTFVALRNLKRSAKTKQLIKHANAAPLEAAFDCYKSARVYFVLTQHTLEFV